MSVSRFSLLQLVSRETDNGSDRRCVGGVEDVNVDTANIADFRRLHHDVVAPIAPGETAPTVVLAGVGKRRRDLRFCQHILGQPAGERAFAQCGEGGSNRLPTIRIAVLTSRTLVRGTRVLGTG